MGGSRSGGDGLEVLRPARAALLALLVVAAGVGVCGAHAIASEHRLAPALHLAARLGINDMAVTQSEHLRHPSWGRSEQGRAGQPVLADPRAATMVVHPRPVGVVR